MDRPVDPVKTARRRYDSSRRQQQARHARERVLREAERYFRADGYAATSVTRIAQAAGVSVDTVYKTFGGKPGLIRAIFDRALHGEQPIAAEQRSDRLQADESDPRQIIAGWARLSRELAPRGAPIVLLIRDAAITDPELATLFDEISDSRLRRMRHNARRMHEAGHLRAGLSVSAAADVLWTYSSAEMYELLVLRRGMSLRRYQQFIADATVAALLPG